MNDFADFGGMSPDEYYFIHDGYRDLGKNNYNDDDDENDEYYNSYLKSCAQKITNKKDYIDYNLKNNNANEQNTYSNNIFTTIYIILFFAFLTWFFLLK